MPYDAPVILSLASTSSAVWILSALGAGLALLVRGWTEAKAEVRAAYATPKSPRWLEDGPMPVPQPELQELGYEPIGVLKQGEGETVCVYTHATLPIYALLRGSKADAALELTSFLSNRGRLQTVGDLGPLRYAAATPTGGIRLVQLRAWGPVTALSLDGQHQGTVKAWIAGNREPLPATREALIGYLEDDDKWVRESLQISGWVPLTVYLRTQFGRPPGVLKF